jgi:hypothetical protein
VFKRSKVLEKRKKELPTLKRDPVLQPKPGSMQQEWLIFISQNAHGVNLSILLYPGSHVSGDGSFNSCWDASIPMRNLTFVSSASEKITTNSSWLNLKIYLYPLLDKKKLPNNSPKISKLLKSSVSSSCFLAVVTKRLAKCRIPPLTTIGKAVNFQKMRIANSISAQKTVN